MDRETNARTQVEQWVIEKLEPLKNERRIVLSDPQRMIQRDARAVDGWAHDSGFNALICTGNFTFRIWFERYRHERDLALLLVDQTREPDDKRKNAPPPVFYPDLQAETRPRALLKVTLRDFLAETTADENWPTLVNGRRLSRLIIDHLDGVLVAHRHLRGVDKTRFTDTDAHRIVLGAMLGINPFRHLSPTDVRRLCMEQHSQLQEVRRSLPEDVTEQLVKAIEASDPPFRWLLTYDEGLVIRAFVLSLLMDQYGMNYRLLLANFDPSLAPLKEIPQETLQKTAAELTGKAPDRLALDVADVETFVSSDAGRVHLLLGELLKLHERPKAILALKTEAFSPLVRSMALASLLADLLANRGVKLHREVLDLLDKEDEELEAAAELFATRKPLPLAVQRPSPAWGLLKKAYRLAHRTLEIADAAREEAQSVRVVKTADLTFQRFVSLWTEKEIGRLDLFISELDRTLRLRELPLESEGLLWDEFRTLWDKAEREFEKLVDRAQQDLWLIQNRFQDLYLARYRTWVEGDSSDVILTHRFVPTFMKRHWTPASGQKAWLLVFDGMRVDAWQELVRPLFLERFDVRDEATGSALIPTETQLSRKAIFAGEMPMSFVDSRENVLLEGALRRHMGTELRLEVVKEEDDRAAGISVQYRSDRLNVIIFNFTDKNLHGNTQDLAFIYRQTVGALIEQDVRGVLRQIGDEDLVFVTSDHGFIPTGNRTIRVSEEFLADARDVNYLAARILKPIDGREEQGVVQFPVQDLRIPPQTQGRAAFSVVAFPRGGSTLQRPRHGRKADRYTHGGLSPAECLVPMVCLGPKQARDLPIRIEDLRVEGSLLEGERAAVVFSLVGSRKDVKVSLDCELAGVRERTEIFPGGTRSYRFEWTLPCIDKPSQEEKDAASTERSISVTARYAVAGKNYRTSETAVVRILLDSSRLRRPGSARLDTVLGLMPRKR